MQRRRALYLMIVTQGLSLVGSRMTGIALGLWLFQQTGRISYLLFVPLFNELPGMLAGAWAGVLVDRWPRRRVLILADSGQALGSLLLWLSFSSGAWQVWQLYAVVLLQGSFAILQGPATDAAVTMLAQPDRLERVNAARQTLFPLAGLIAPVLVGALYPRVGVGGIVLADLGTFLASVVSLSLITIPDPAISAEVDEPAGDQRSAVLAGLRYLLRRRSLLWLVLYYSYTNLLLNGPLELTLPYLLRVTDNQLLMSLLLGVMNLGALLGAVLTWRVRWQRGRVRAILIGMSLNGGLLILFGILRQPLLLGIALLLLMTPLPLAGALFTSLLQRKTPADMQGRVFAVASQLAFLLTPVSFLVTGPLVDRVVEPAVLSGRWQLFAPLFGDAPGSGMGLVLSAAGLLILLGTAVAAACPALRELEQRVPDCLP